MQFLPIANSMAIGYTRIIGQVFLPPTGKIRATEKTKLEFPNIFIHPLYILLYIILYIILYILLYILLYVVHIM